LFVAPYLSLSSLSIGSTRFDVYLLAHPDDWLYFMLPNLYLDLRSGGRVILIEVSAGSPDASEAGGGATIGLNATATLPNALMWGVAMQAGSNAAFAFAANSVVTGSGKITIDGHQIWYQNYGSATLLTMDLVTPAYGRLTCGGTNQTFANTEGYGWPITGCESIGQLHLYGKPISALDGSTTYTSWKDLVSTIQGILDYYDVPHSSLTTLNGQEYDRSLDTISHPDHIEVGNIAHALGAGGYTMRYYLSYTIENMPPNVSGGDLTIKQDMWTIFWNAVSQSWGYSVNNYYCQIQCQWLSRQYFRTVTGATSIITSSAVTTSGITLISSNTMSRAFNSPPSIATIKTQTRNSICDLRARSFRLSLLVGPLIPRPTNSL
jgi:hypothetical protein